MPDNPYYVRKKTGFSTMLEDVVIEPLIYQPTPEGITELCNHYNTKYGIDLRSVDLRNQVESPNNALHFFKYLQKNPLILDVNEGTARGIILNHGHFHAIPVLVCKINDIQHIVVFDSTSGSRVQGYYGIANLFPNSHFYLNAGTRQADEGSCITDAICVLKEALIIAGLIDIIHSKNIEHCHALRVTMFSPPKPTNFHLFKMPEQLLVTAQSSKYVVEADADLTMILRGGNSLGYFRNKYRMDVSLSKDEGVISTNINSYLYLKAKEHKQFLDIRWNQMQALAAPPVEEELNVLLEENLLFAPIIPETNPAIDIGLSFSR